MKYKISIVVPFYYFSNIKNKPRNNFSLLAFEKCLEAICKSNYKNYEVIAVSDGSNKESINIVKRYKCKLIKIKKNSGAANTRNKGAKVAKGDILVFLDSDVEIKNNALDVINKHFNNKKNFLLQGIYSHKPNYKSPTNQYLQSYYSYYIFTETKKKKYIQTLVTNIFSIRKKLFIENKGFDSNFSGANVEDQEFGFRLIKKGYKIPINRKLNTIHHVNFGMWDFVKKITKIQIGEMKMHLRNKKTFVTKSKQSNYFGVIAGIILMTFMLSIIFTNLFIKIPYFFELLISLNFIFLLIYIRFFKFILIRKGFKAAIIAIFYTYLHRIVVTNCVISGIIDFYILKNKY